MVDVTTTGKQFSSVKQIDVQNSIYLFRYYAGWSDKNHGKTVEVGLNVLTPPQKPTRLNCSRQAKRSLHTLVTSLLVLLYVVYVNGICIVRLTIDDL